MSARDLIENYIVNLPGEKLALALEAVSNLATFQAQETDPSVLEASLANLCQESDPRVDE